MKIIQNREYALASTDVLGINNKEMRQMCELKSRIGEILDNHQASDEELKKNKLSRIYANDDELKLMFAILAVFTKDFENTQTSVFDDFMNQKEEPLQDDDEE